ncbi:MAG: dipeptide epimerase [Chitinophagales bacterium]|nr:dipeptide epimerase [Chitinophagaceae bacterium]MCB9063937.1 dipeptide epimerase [Chitinophagales bacterium]
MQLRHFKYDLAFKYPFTTYKGTKTHQPMLVVALSMGRLYGCGEVGAISYYDVTVDGMIEQLEAKRNVIERYSITDPERFWHFLHHLLPGQNFLIAALDIAGWDLFAKMRNKPIYELLGLKWENVPMTDYTIGMDDMDEMVKKLKQNPWPLYKVKMGRPDDIDLVKAIRDNTNASIRVDANEGWQFEDAKRIIPELEQLGVQMIEQPLHRDQHEAMKELKAISPLPLFADESCQVEGDIERCADEFHGVNVKLAKCGGITPAVRMIKSAKEKGLKTMVGAMCEANIGSAAIAQLMPMLDEVDADGPLLLKEDIATGLTYKDGIITLSGKPGLGVDFIAKKFEK